MITTVIFDFDGVIVESTKIKTMAFGKLFEHEHPEQVTAIVYYHVQNAGISRYEKFRYIYKEILKRHLSDDEFQALCVQFARIVMNEVIKAPYVKGAREFLENYASTYRCFVASATPQEEIEKIIEERNSMRFFGKIYGAPYGKSNAVKDILRKEEIEPLAAAYVGDALSDYHAAKDNSINFVARINENETIFEDIDCVKVKDLTNLHNIFEEL